MSFIARYRCVNVCRMIALTRYDKCARCIPRLSHKPRQSRLPLGVHGIRQQLLPPSSLSRRFKSKRLARLPRSRLPLPLPRLRLPLRRLLRHPLQHPLQRQRQRQPQYRSIALRTFLHCGPTPLPLLHLWQPSLLCQPSDVASRSSSRAPMRRLPRRYQVYQRLPMHRLGLRASPRWLTFSRSKSWKRRASPRLPLCERKRYDAPKRTRCLVREELTYMVRRPSSSQLEVHGAVARAPPHRQRQLQRQPPRPLPSRRLLLP